MIVSYKWLKELVDFDFTPEELAHKLTMVGLEVESCELIGGGLDTVVVARLESVEKHPDADKLTVCQVNNGTETVQVVCGATNHTTGDLVALAQPGTVLPGDFKIKKSKIRGQVSFGMLCSESELALSEESAGILILPADLALGTPVFEAMGLTDARMEIGLTPNRPDCLSQLGVAREIAALAGTSIHLPEVQVEEAGTPAADETSVDIQDSDLCPRYTARLIRGVKIGPSPSWMVRRLEAVGQRSVNNVVDVTNYVLMELGHPLHAFDYNLLRGRRIVVKRAGEGEAFTTLDDQVRSMTANDLMICDGEGSVALAGIMGGQNSEVGEETVDILLESAWFNPIAIRRTSKRLGMHTEASHRFERGADIDMAPVALDRAAQLIAELAGGQVAPGVIDAYPAPLQPQMIELHPEKAVDLLGVQISAGEMKSLLEGIELKVDMQEEGSEAVLNVAVPSFRPDLEREVDLIEEVARLYGYDRIPTTMPQGPILPQQATRRQKKVRKARDLMVAAGFDEAVNYSFISPTAWDRLLLAEDDPRRTNVKVLNPLTEEQSVMRTSLVPSLLETASRNLAYRTLDLRLFEMRPVFRVAPENDLPVETLRLAGVMTGRRYSDGWAQSDDTVDFYDLKGAVENLLASFLVERLQWDTDHGEPYLHPGKSARILSGKKVLGILGEVHPKVQQAFELDRPAYLFDLDMDVLFDVCRDFGGFQPLSRFPGVHRDSALLVDEAVTAQELLQTLKGIKVRDMEGISLFDVYTGKGIPEGKKSLAIRVSYRSAEKTLTDDDVRAAHDKIVRVLCEKMGAEIR